MLTAIRTGPSESLRKNGLRGADSLSRSAIRKCEKTQESGSPRLRRLFYTTEGRVGSRWCGLRSLFFNENCANEIGRLANPRNDVVLLEQAFKGLGFDVTVVRDAGRALTRAVNTYARRYRPPARVPSRSSTLSQVPASASAHSPAHLVRSPYLCCPWEVP
jgi:hypothetical protein